MDASLDENPHALRRGGQGQRSPKARLHRIAVIMNVEAGLGDHEDSESSVKDISMPSGGVYEEEHVHKVYQQIASHFSSTRYKVGF